MDAGTKHAVAMMALLVAVVPPLAVLKRRRPTNRQFTIALAFAALGMFTASSCAAHLCREGQPRTQLLVLGPCLLLILLFVKSTAWRRTLGALTFLGMLGLSNQFSDIVHEPGWTGNPEWDRGMSVTLRSHRQCAASVAADSDDPAAEMPAGWLREMPVWPTMQDRFVGRLPARREITATWHTWFTGLYRYTAIPQDLWYPGGPLAEGMTRLELRDRASR